MCQRSGDGPFSGWFKGYTPFPDFELLDARKASALNKTIHNFTTRKRSVWRNRKLKQKIDSFAEDRSLTWPTITSGSLASMNPYLNLPTYLQLLFETTIFRNLIRDGTRFYLSWKPLNTHLAFALRKLPCLSVLMVEHPSSGHIISRLEHPHVDEIKKLRCQHKICSPDVLLQRTVCSILELLELMLRSVHEISFWLLF